MSRETDATGTWVLLNGARHPLPPSGLLVDLLATLGVTADTPAVAVAVNGRVVPRSAWAESRIGPGDAVEVVRPIQGGAPGDATDDIAR
jgi:sulfur carrier protein